jgi:endo-1,4-beta-mannosidase
MMCTLWITRAEETEHVTDNDRFLTGVNYWPRKKAMYWWSDFDPAEVADEFDVIAELGMSIVRIFLLWDDWQKTPDSVERRPLADLGKVCDLAAERGLKLDVTFFTGHMSGPNWAPAWLLDAKATHHASPHVRQVMSGGVIADTAYRNMFNDPTAMAAERLLLTTVVSEYKDHDAIWMWNLGNEPDLFAYPTSDTDGHRWATEMSEFVRDLDASHLVTTGLHVASLVENNGLRVDHVFGESDLAVMHGYPMYADWSAGPLDPDFVPFTCALTAALSGKPCLAEEWGGCTSPDTADSVVWRWNAYGHDRTQFMAGEEALADYVGAVLPRLVEVGSPGSFLWCFADYARELWDRPPCDELGAKHERHFGLVRPDGSLKPHAEVVKKFAATDPIVTPAKRTFVLDVTPDEYYQDPARHARRLYARYRDV